MTTKTKRAKTEALLEDLRLADVLDECWQHPAPFMNEISVTDPKTGEKFRFSGMMDPSDGWAWQREVLDWWMANPRSIILKARQLGITWVAAALALWYLMFKPGSRVLVYSIGEDEAKLVVRRIWLMYQSLPDSFKEHIKVIKPERARLPSEELVFGHSDSEISSLRALSSTQEAGHSETASLVILDEYSRNPYAQAIWKATQPTMSGGGKTIAVSTANGIAGDFDGANFFYHLWTNAEQLRVDSRFLGWDMHPDRDREWYEENAMALPAKDRAEQFPANPEEAFIGTGECWFDRDALQWYLDRGLKEPRWRFKFQPTNEGRDAKLQPSKDGLIRVYARPDKDKGYAIAVDPSGGTGLDYTVAYVIDLHTQALAAEIRTSVTDADEVATQLHYLGRWYNSARIAIERTGGWGAVMITALRDGRGNRPPYPKLYRHRDQIRPDLREEPRYGFPTTTVTRPQIISGMEIAIREKTLPWLTRDLFQEAQTFGAHVSRTGRPIMPSPSAAQGCNDDCVIACAIALELYRLYGQAPTATRVKSRQRSKRKRLAPQPWLRA